MMNDQIRLKHVEQTKKLWNKQLIISLEIRTIFGWRMIIILFIGGFGLTGQNWTRRQTNLSYCNLVHHKCKPHCFAFDFRFRQTEWSSSWCANMLNAIPYEIFNTLNRTVDLTSLNIHPCGSGKVEIYNVVLFSVSFSDRNALCLWALPRITFSCGENSFREKQLKPCDVILNL